MYIQFFISLEALKITGFRNQKNLKIALIPSGEAWILTSMLLCWLHQISEPVGGTETCDSQEDHKVSSVLFPMALELSSMLIYFFLKLFHYKCGLFSRN